MQKQCIPLAEFQETGAIRSESILALLIVKAILAFQHDMLRRVLQTHITERFPKTQFPVVGDRVARQDTVAGNHLRTIQ